MVINTQKNYVFTYFIFFLQFSAALQINLQVVNDNISNNELNLTEMLPQPYAEVSKAINEIVSNIAAINVKLTKIQPETIDLDSLEKDELTKTNLFIVENLLADEKVININIAFITQV